MKNLFTGSNFVSFLLIAFVIVLHGFLRFSEIPYSKLYIPTYFWEASINLAAGKGFYDPGFTDQTVLNQSPEIAKFINSMPLYKTHVGGKLSLSDTFYDFRAYKANPIKKIELKDSIGYRYTLGIIWKYFGFNWYFVGTYNYLFSLLALLALMYCSYRTLGIAYSISIGLIYSIAMTEIFFVIALARDGIPLWFACYLICGLVMFFNKPLTLKRITAYSIIMGAIIFASVQGRTSCIYFLPLLALIYFIMFFFFQKEKIEFKYSYLIKSLVLQKTFLFFFATFLTFFSEIILQEIASLILLKDVEPGNSCFMHAVFLGLGMWSLDGTCPSPLYYHDEHVYYLAKEYGRRVLEITSMPLLSKPNHEALVGLYISIIKMFPHFFVAKVVFGSFINTLLYLGDPSIYITADSAAMKFVSSYLTPNFQKPYLAMSALLGGLILYIKLNQKRMTAIFVLFILFNAGVSFIQYNGRHVLMGHPAYYFLTGVTLAYILVSSYNSLRYLKNNFIFSTNIFDIISKTPRTKSFKMYKSIVNFKFNPIIALILGILVIGLYYLIPMANEKLKTIEEQNIRTAHTYFDSLEKHPLEFDPTQNALTLPPSLLHKTAGIFCELGQVELPSTMNIEILLKEPVLVWEEKYINEIIYNKNIKVINGKNVILFTSFYFVNKTAALKISNLCQCKSLYWIDLKDWKGPLLEGTYDREVIKGGVY